MKKALYPLLILSLLSLTALRSDKPAYLVYNQKGKTADYGDILKAALSSDIILFGEIHNNPVCHWLEYELMRDIYQEKKSDLVLGAEMLETDNQLLVNEYISKRIRKKDFESEAKLWPSYKNNYAPLVDFARENGLKFIATNVPRRFAAMVNQKGFEGLDSLLGIERGMMAALPIHYDSTLNGYKSMRENIGGDMPAHLSANLPKAQALKDATMAQCIVKNIAENKTTFLHFNGAYHSDNYEGIVWYVNDYVKRTNFPIRILTISCVEQDTISVLSKENIGKADFIICIPSSMTSTN
ncbi:MAG: ChaN family lipoprotein [bacterium]